MRFPNFNSTWQKNKFENLLTLLKNNTLSRAELNYENGRIKNIHYGDVLIKFNDFVLSDSKIIPYINDNSIPHNYADLLLKTGDLIIADTAEDYTVGKATELIFNDQSLIISGLHTIPCRPINDIFGSKYLGYYINSPSFHNQLLPLIQGIKVSSISKSQIVDTFISYPKIDEQCKITEFLTLIDQRIDTQSKIIEKYESLIKAISNILISKTNGKVVTLSEIAQIYQPETISQSKFNENGKYTVFGANGLIGHYNFYNHENAQICITCRGATCGNVNLSLPKSWITGNSMVINTDKCTRINKMYLYYLLKNYNFKSIISGSGQPQIVREPISAIKINLPRIQDQNEIVKILNAYNELLIKEKDILELYKKQKAYLLKNMFI